LSTRNRASKRPSCWPRAQSARTFNQRLSPSPQKMRASTLPSHLLATLQQVIGVTAGGGGAEGGIEQTTRPPTAGQRRLPRPLLRLSPWAIQRFKLKAGGAVTATTKASDVARVPSYNRPYEFAKARVLVRCVSVHPRSCLVCSGASVSVPGAGTPDAACVSSNSDANVQRAGRSRDDRCPGSGQQRELRS
jgi:hypothetical protein